jgi:hypothetical protein
MSSAKDTAKSSGRRHLCISIYAELRDMGQRGKQMKMKMTSPSSPIEITVLSKTGISWLERLRYLFIVADGSMTKI